MRYSYLDPGIVVVVFVVVTEGAIDEDDATGNTELLEGTTLEELVVVTGFVVVPGAVIELKLPV